MSADRPNILVICGDEHTRELLGCAGNPMVSTPHLDALAADGTRFSSAYTPYPICGPARAALATGRYAHQVDMWDSASPYDGSVRSWAHRLRDHGYDVSSIGKLHFRNGADDNGFAEEIHPMYATGGIGWVRGL
ncbi:MAG: sulfatase-like hydrolase/transferase, partial [Actinomycetota bacterium]|nr:sulfatase-like hydrolase/transferase [Actinomycetota bacterium]